VHFEFNTIKSAPFLASGRRDILFYDSKNFTVIRYHNSPDMHVSKNRSIVVCKGDYTNSFFALDRYESRRAWFSLALTRSTSTGIQSRQNWNVSSSVNVQMEQIPTSQVRNWLVCSITHIAMSKKLSINQYQVFEEASGYLKHSCT